MAEPTLPARWFLIGGAVLAVFSLLLWLTLPIPMHFPPYLTTALLVLIYGGYLLKSRPPVRGKKPPA